MPSNAKVQPYDQRLAAILAARLAAAGVHPNLVTLVSLILALGGAALFAEGQSLAASLGAALFVLARFLDHVDGSLAAATDKKSRFGYYFDYATGALGYAALFLGMGFGFAEGVWGNWALALGGAGALAALVSAVLNVDLDRVSGLSGGESVGYPAYGGFELEDGIYLLAPITWLGWLTPLFVAAGIGAALYCLWTLTRLIAAYGSRSL